MKNWDLLVRALHPILQCQRLSSCFLSAIVCFCRGARQTGEGSLQVSVPWLHSTSAESVSPGQTDPSALQKHTLPFSCRIIGRNSILFASDRSIIISAARRRGVITARYFISSTVSVSGTCSTPTLASDHTPTVALPYNYFQRTG